jgi:hypothetical protein
VATPRRRDVEVRRRQTRARGIDVRNPVGDSAEAVAGGGIGGHFDRTRHLDGHAAHAEEEDPQAARREVAVEGQAQSQRIAVDRAGGGGVVAEDDDVIQRADRCGRRNVRLPQRQRRRGRVVLDDHQRQAAGRRGGQQRARPAARLRRLGRDLGRRGATFPRAGVLDSDAAAAQGRRAGVDVVAAEGEREQSVAALRDGLGNAPAQASLAGAGDQLDVGVLEPKQRIRGAGAGVNTAPRRRSAEQLRGAFGCGREIADGDDRVIEGVQHA